MCHKTLSLIMKQRIPKKFFHKLSKADLDRYIAKKALLNWFRQPTWCNYPGALDGWAGCWSLVGRMVTGRSYCRRCECSADYREPDTMRIRANVNKYHRHRKHHKRGNHGQHS